MAKTLVALYDTIADAERVVHELIAGGFARSNIHLALDPTTRGAVPTVTGAQDAAYEGAHLVETLADAGVPYDEAYAYTEGCGGAGALVGVESSDDQAERGMEILRQVRPVSLHGRTTQWQQEGWTGAAYAGGRRPHRRPRRPARRSGHAPPRVARTTRRSGFR